MLLAGFGQVFSNFAAGCFRIGASVWDTITVDTLKRLPWRSLILATLMAIAAIKGVELILHFGFRFAPDLFVWIVNPIGGIILEVGGGLAFGGFGSLFLQRVDPINARYLPTRWGLVLCLLIGLWLSARLPISAIPLVADSPTHLLGVMLGVFWRGR
jgi:hypothetical protein